MKSRKRTTKGKANQFVMLKNTFIFSDVFKRLTNAARVAWILLRSQIKYEGDIDVKFPYSDAQEFMDRNTWRRAIVTLEREGLIEKIQEGGLFRRTNIYRLVYSIRGMDSHTLRKEGNAQTGMEMHTVTSGNAPATVGKSIPSTVCKSPLECDAHEWAWSVKDKKYKCAHCGVLTYSREGSNAYQLSKGKMLRKDQ
jgi:hypothetical protein